MALENSMLVMNGKQVGGNTQDLTGYQTKVDNNLETESKEIAGAINELRSEKADTDIVAADFNAGTSYTAGNYCIYEGKFYKFKANHSGAWSAADVDEIKIAGELASLKSGLTSRLMKAQTSVTAADFLTFVAGVFDHANGVMGDNSDLLINAEWAGQNNYTFIVHKINSNTLYAIIYCIPMIYQADYISGVTTSRAVQLVS